ncbi:MAG TPA: hypothetical protein VFM86_05370 [Pedococcus sp.]|nr:hypothetical protein [Pedococcus sp.]
MAPPVIAPDRAGPRSVRWELGVGEDLEVLPAHGFAGRGLVGVERYGWVAARRGPGVDGARWPDA